MALISSIAKYLKKKKKKKKKKKSKNQFSVVDKVFGAVVFVLGGGGEEFWIKNHVNWWVGWELVGRVRGMNKYGKRNWWIVGRSS